MKIENLAKEAFEGVIVVQHEVQDLGKQTIVTNDNERESAF